MTESEETSPRLNGEHKQPNVIVFLTDQQRFDSAGVHGNPLGLTPNFDRVASEGTHFSQMFTCQPVCGPARSCLQTGKYATATGCYRNGIPLPENEKTLAHYFSEANYDTAYIGKWHLADKQAVPPSMRGGYRHWLASNTLEFSSDAYRTVLFDENEEPVRLPGYRVDALTDAAIRYIHASSAEDKPFFLCLSFLEPHHQNHRDDFPAPDGYAQRYHGGYVPPDLAALGGNAHQQLGGYWGMVKRLDEALGRLLDALKSLDMAQDTIVLITSDHGCHFKTRNDEYKRSCHESSIRVPGAAIGPGFNGGGRVRGLVSLVDVAPTLLDAAGIAVPTAMQGKSVMPALRGDPVEGMNEAFIQVSESQIGRAIRTGRWKYAVKAPDEVPRRQPYAPVYEEDCLYDLMADPYELTNLIELESHRPLANHLRERLLFHMKAAGEVVGEIVPAPVRPSGQRSVLPDELFE